MDRITDARRHPNEVLRAMREQAFVLRAKGKSVAKIAEYLGVTKAAVYKWLNNAKKLGDDMAIQGGDRGRKLGDKRLLTKKQEKQLREWITDKTPQQMKLEFALWTRRAVRGLILEKFGISLTLKGVGDYLKRFGMTSQRPMIRAYEQDPQKVQAWLDEEYPEIQRRAKAEGAIIYWGDETAVKPDSNWVKGYAPKGETPILQRNDGRWKSTTMVSAVSNQGLLRFRLQDKPMNAELFIEFLEGLIQDEERKIFLIVDNLSVHKSKTVKDWVSAHRDRIELFFLPPYSPELNPDEYVNRALKTKIRMTPAIEKGAGEQFLWWLTSSCWRCRSVWSTSWQSLKTDLYNML